MSKNNEIEINLMGVSPLAPLVDGHKITMNDEKTEADIVFFQLIPDTAKDSKISGVPVAHLRLSTEQLDALAKNIANARQ